MVSREFMSHYCTERFQLAPMHMRYICITSIDTLDRDEDFPNPVDAAFNVGGGDALAKGMAGGVESRNNGDNPAMVNDERMRAVV